MDLEEAVAKHKLALEIAKEILEYLQKVENELIKIDIKTLRGSGL